MAKISNLTKGLSKSKKKSSGSKKGSKKIRHTHIEHHDDGSHSIRHMFDQEPGPDATPIPDQSHGVGDADGLLQHMQGQFGGQLPPAAGAAGGGGAAPAGPPAGGM